MPSRCQQLSLNVGLELLNRLAALCGVRQEADGHTAYAFPEPHEVARLPPSQLLAIGFSRQKVRALLALAGGIDRHVVDLSALSRHGDDTARSRTARTPRGRTLDSRVRSFSVASVGCMCSRATTSGLRTSLVRWLARPDELDYAGVTRAVERWRPYAGMAVLPPAPRRLVTDGG